MAGYTEKSVSCRKSGQHYLVSAQGVTPFPAPELRQSLPAEGGNAFGLPCGFIATRPLLQQRNETGYDFS